MYKAVDRKNKSEEVDRTSGREVYDGRSMWRCNEGIQKCAVHYEMTQIQTGTRGIKIGQRVKSFSKLISSKITKSTHCNKYLELRWFVSPNRVTPVGPPPHT